MKLNQYSAEDQATVGERSDQFEWGQGDRLASSNAPPRGARDRHESLLYHSETNSDNRKEKKPYKPTSNQAKTFQALELNSKYWLKKYTAEHIGILTLTFKENLKCHKESQRRWNNLNRLINRAQKFDVLVKVKEYQKRGAIHYHMLVKTHERIRGNIDWEIYEQMGNEKTVPGKRKLGKELGKTATPHLRELWSWLRQKGKATGFGRIELMPLKKPHHIKNYIGKYLEKDMQKGTSNEKGMNMITYGKKAPKVANTKVSWLNGKGGMWRRKLKMFCDARGIKDEDELVDLYGKAWSYHLYPYIMNDRILGDYQKQEHDELTDPENKVNKAVYPWKGVIVSGAHKYSTKENVIEQYLTDDEIKRTNFYKHAEHHRNWTRAKKHKQLHEKIFHAESKFRGHINNHETLHNHN